MTEEQIKTVIDDVIRSLPRGELDARTLDTYIRNQLLSRGLTSIYPYTVRMRMVEEKKLVDLGANRYRLA